MLPCPKTGWLESDSARICRVHDLPDWTAPRWMDTTPASTNRDHSIAERVANGEGKCSITVPPERLTDFSRSMPGTMSSKLSPNRKSTPFESASSGEFPSGTDSWIKQSAVRRYLDLDHSRCEGVAPARILPNLALTTNPLRSATSPLSYTLAGKNHKASKSSLAE